MRLNRKLRAGREGREKKRGQGWKERVSATSRGGKSTVVVSIKGLTNISHQRHGGAVAVAAETSALIAVVMT